MTLAQQKRFQKYLTTKINKWIVTINQEQEEPKKKSATARIVKPKTIVQL